MFLDDRRLLKNICVDATKKGLRKVHVTKAVNNLILVTLEDTVGLHRTRAIVSGLDILTLKIWSLETRL